MKRSVAPTDEEIAADLPGSPDSVRVTRQFVGSLAPLPFDDEDEIELPMSGLRPAGVRRVVLAGVIVAVVAIGAVGVWQWRAATSAPEPATTGSEIPNPQR